MHGCRTARKVHGRAFRQAIERERYDLLKEACGLQTSWQPTESNQSSVGGQTSNSVNVYVRKRPLLPHEPLKHEYDVVTCLGDTEVVVHDCQMYAGRPVI